MGLVQRVEDRCYTEAGTADAGCNASQGISGLIATHLSPSTTSTRSLVTNATPKAVELQISTDQYSTVR